MPKSASQSISQLIRTEYARRILKSECTHEHMYIGLDAGYCPDCGGEFSPRSKEYLALLATDREPKNCSGATLISAPEQLAPEQLRHWVETYSPSNRPQSYYRYVWMDGRKLRHRHIKGGDIHSTSAIALKAEVESAIASGKSPPEIEQLIRSNYKPQ